MPAKHWFLLLLFPLILCLSACSNCCNKNQTANTCACRIAYEPPCCCKVRSCENILALRAYGVQIIQVGDDVKIILPVDRFFLCQTSALNPHYEFILVQVAKFISCQEKYNLKITGYTNNGGCPLRDLALSRQQAQVIADFLWKACIDSRTIVARGCGSANPIACDNSCKGRSLNRRIEITWRKITDFYDY